MDIYTVENTSTKAQEFIHCLKQLFVEMILSDEQSISPDKRIAEMALSFGEQQDVTECLESILNMFQSAFTGDSRSIIQSLFFGRIKQTLSYSKQGKMECSTKDEEFNSLIVDVFDDIYVCLDTYFSQGQVEVENTIGVKYQSILKLPQCLLIHINRVKFDQAAMNAYKSNQFTQFYDSLYLDRYMDSNFDACNDRRAKMIELRAELAEKQKVLDELGKKSGDSPPPLQILENAVTVLLKDKESSLAQELAKDIRVSIQKLKDEIASIQTKIISIQTLINDFYSDMKNIEYKLHAVFIHEGDAEYGHYWLYLWNQKQSQWLKYNDSVVTRVSESVVFQDTTGKNMNVVALGYVKAGTSISILNRTDEFRKHYRSKTSI
jgi:ubiquitin C-terminal hydrolase